MSLPQRLSKPVPIGEQRWQDAVEPTVSVLCVTYNHARSIRQALDGFLMQETTFPVEIVIHDDASTDGTDEILASYAARYPRLLRLVIQKENQYSARGFQFICDQFSALRGKFFAFCEGDDYWIYARKLQAQVEILENDPSISLVFHEAWVEDARLQRTYLLNENLTQKRFSCREVAERPWFMASASLMLRRLESTDRELWSYAMSGDVLMQLYACIEGDALFLNEPWSVYKREGGGVSEAWRDQEFLYKRLHPNLIWTLLAFAERVGAPHLLEPLQRRIGSLLSSVITHSILTESPRLWITPEAVVKNTWKLIVQSRPQFMAKTSLDRPIAFSPLLKKEAARAWRTHGIKSLCRNAVKSLLYR